MDIGAATPGLIIDVPDMWAEGMLMDAVKLYEGGTRRSHCGNISVIILESQAW